MPAPAITTGEDGVEEDRVALATTVGSRPPDRHDPTPTDALLMPSRLVQTVS